MEPSGLILLPYLASAVRSDLCDLYAICAIIANVAYVTAGGYAGTWSILIALDGEKLTSSESYHG